MNKAIERTRSGLPALWECGGGYSNTGYATIITSIDGQPKRAIYVRRRGELANSEHALIPISVGDYVISASHHRRDFEIRIWRIDQIREEDAQFTLVNKYSQSEWDSDLDKNLYAAVEAAKKKATCYHCRAPHYVVRD